MIDSTWISAIKKIIEAFSKLGLSTSKWTILTILPRGKHSWSLLSNNIAAIFACKTRWVEIHSCFKTFGELYEHVVTYFNAMVNPYVCTEINERCWNWDSETKTTSIGMKNSLRSFGVIVGFTILKNSLDYFKGLSAKLQSGDIWGIHNDWQYQIRDSMFEGWHWCIIPEMVRWSKAAGFIYIGTKGKLPRIPRIQCNRSNVPADTPLCYKRSIGIHFIDILLQQLQNHFSADNCWPVSA